MGEEMTYEFESFDDAHAYLLRHPVGVLIYANPLDEWVVSTDGVNIVSGKNLLDCMGKLATKMDETYYKEGITRSCQLVINSLQGRGCLVTISSLADMTWVATVMLNERFATSNDACLYAALLDCANELGVSTY